jgi:hypothetical protein
LGFEPDLSDGCQSVVAQVDPGFYIITYKYEEVKNGR